MNEIVHIMYFTEKLITKFLVLHLLPMLLEISLLGEAGDTDVTGVGQDLMGIFQVRVAIAHVDECLLAV